MLTQPIEDTDEHAAIEPDTDTSEVPEPSEIVYEVETDVVSEITRPPLRSRRSS